MNRADTINVQGHVLNSEEDLKVLGPSLCTGGAPETNTTFAAAWRAFHAKRHQLTAKHLPQKVRWDRWELFVAPVLSYGSWGWVCCQYLHRQFYALVHRMIRVMFGVRPRVIESWVEWNRISIREARAWAVKLEETS